ncbi:Omp28-related outer membrane protein [Agriterribacter sp.]|uniref:Omp28-related outer membrane protein n=1 Tax=Agriterribacter sp. TaxID=2821509 RepID=UPI002CA9A0FE|nr:Omp28-related outer membrane protein [Agriterribacter sp.]HRO46678.1 Omp28-related outer membrane protein [Agriterribacter sp.]HRQ16982.1 Omp28-related outer membrane protein [Agriterribacter sp.]
MKHIVKIFSFCVFALAINACTKGSGPDGDNNQGGSDTSSFTKNVLIMEFVSFDCVYCPKVSDLIAAASETKYPGRIDLISVHGRLDENDPMEFSGYKQFQNYFYGVTGYPGVIIDQRDDLVTVGEFDATSGSFIERAKATAKIGIALGTAVTGDNTVRVEVQVANRGEASADYRLAVAVLENDIPYRQADLVDGSLKWIEDYRHFHVLRAYLTGNYFGDELGTIAKNGVYAKTFTYTIPSGYVKENLSFVAYVIEAKGFAPRVSVNSRSVHIGKSVDFSGNIK